MFFREKEIHIPERRMNRTVLSNKIFYLRNSHAVANSLIAPSHGDLHFTASKEGEATGNDFIADSLEGRHIFVHYLGLDLLFLTVELVYQEKS